MQRECDHEVMVSRVVMSVPEWEWSESDAAERGSRSRPRPSGYTAPLPTQEWVVPASDLVMGFVRRCARFRQLPIDETGSWVPHFVRAHSSIGG